MKLSSLLGHASELLQHVRSTARPADSVIDSFFRSHKYLGSHDRRFIAESVYGTLRHLRRCESVLLDSVGKDADDVLPEDGITLLLLAYLLHIDRRTTLGPADVQPLIKSGRLRPRISSILESLAADDEGRFSRISESVERVGMTYSFPDWMVSRLLKQFGEVETVALFQSLNEQAPVVLRANTLKSSVEECQSALENEGVNVERTAISPLGLRAKRRLNVFQLQAFRDGKFEVQDEGSQLLPLLLDPKPTAKVLDACAGAGGKTLELAALMKNRGEIVAADVHSTRLEELRKRARRGGVSNVRIRHLGDLAELEENYREHFDLVLIDAPCSGIGTIRRNPGMKWMVTEETVEELSGKQRHILDASAPLVAAGGILAYATCTFFREENEDVVETFLSAHPDFSLRTPSPSVNGIDVARYLDGPYVRLLPHRDGTDGFFLAVLKKQAPQGHS